MDATENQKMSGQEHWTNRNELRWAVGTDESGPARVEHEGKVVFTGTYAQAVSFLEKRGNRPARTGRI